MSAGGVFNKVKYNPSTMANTLPSTQFMKRCDNCCGIHGAARLRKGIKHGTVCARRRLDKQIIQKDIKDYP